MRGSEPLHGVTTPAGHTHPYTPQEPRRHCALAELGSVRRLRAPETMKKAILFAGVLAALAGATIRRQDFRVRAGGMPPRIEQRFLLPWQTLLSEPANLPSKQRVEWEMTVHSCYGLNRPESGSGSIMRITLECDAA